MIMKIATTTEEQIKCLKERGLIIEDEAKASEILLDIGYYRLGFYLFPFEVNYPNLENRDHKFNPGTLFDSAVVLYYFDFDLRNLLLRYTSRIEVALRTYITYYISNKYKHSPTWFVDTNIIDPKFKKKFKPEIYSKILIRVPALKRHHNKYINDKFAPAWKTIEFLSFGSVLKLYKALKNLEDKRAIAAHFNVKKISVFENYIDTIVFIRNQCAHGNALFDLSMPKSIASGPIKIKQNHEYTLATAIDVILYILDKVSSNRARELKKLLKEIIKDSISKNANIEPIIEKVVNF